MAAQIAQLGRALRAWEPDISMPVVYLWVLLAGTLTYKHYNCMPGTSLYPVPINTTDVNTIIDQLHDERHELFSTHADIRPDIIGKIYYDSAIHKRLPETQAECNALGRVLHSCFTSPNGTKWITPLYEGRDALTCGTWYDETGWTPRSHPWPFIIDYWLQWDDHRFGEASGCERPHSRCYNSDKSLKPQVRKPSEAVATSSVVSTQATETTTTTITVTVSKWDGHIRLGGNQECRQIPQPFPKHPTRTSTECVLITTTTTMPVTTYRVKTVLETHHVNGTPPTVFSRDLPTTVDGESYLCEWPICETSTAIQWESATITVTHDPNTSPTTIISSFDSKVADAQDEYEDIITPDLGIIERFWNWTQDTLYPILEWALADPRDAVEYQNDAWYRVARYWVLLFLRYLVHLPVLLALKMTCAFMVLFGSLWRVILTTIRIIGLLFYRPLRIIALIFFNVAGSRDPVSQVESIEMYRDRLGVINTSLAAIQWLHNRVIDLNSGCGGVRDSFCRVSFLQGMSGSMRHLNREVLRVVYDFFQRTSAGLVPSAEYCTSNFIVSQKASELQHKLVAISSSVSGYGFPGITGSLLEKFNSGGSDSPSAVSLSSRYFFYDGSTAEYIARFSFIVAVMVAIHSYPVIATRFKQHAFYAYQVLVVLLAYSYIMLLCNFGGFWYGDWLPFTVGYLVARQCYSFTKKAEPWKFDTTQRLREFLGDRLDMYRKKHYSYIWLECLAVIVYLWFFMPCRSLGDACPRCLDDTCTRCPDPTFISPSPYLDNLGTLWVFGTTVVFAYQSARSIELEYCLRKQMEKQMIPSPKTEGPSTFLFKLGEKMAAEHWPLLFWAFAVALGVFQRYYTIGYLNWNMMGSALYIGVNIHRFGFGRRIGDVPSKDEIPLYSRLLYHTRESIETLFGLREIQKHSVGSQFMPWSHWAMIFQFHVFAFVAIWGLSSWECHGLNLIRWSNIIVLASIPSILFLYKLYCRYSDESRSTTAPKAVFRYHWYGLLGSTTVYVYAVWVLGWGFCMNDPLVANMTVLIWSLVPWSFGRTESLWQEFFNSTLKVKGSRNTASKNKAQKDKVPEDKASKDQSSKGKAPVDKASEEGSSAAGSSSKRARSANSDNDQPDEETRTKKATTEIPASASNTKESTATPSGPNKKVKSERQEMMHRIMSKVNEEIRQDDEEALKKKNLQQKSNQPATDKPGSNEAAELAKQPDGNDEEANDAEETEDGEDDAQQSVNEGSASEAGPDVKTKAKRRKLRGKRKKHKDL